MEKKINIAELLKNCPKGMELDCTMYENLYLDKIEEEFRYPIECYTIYDGCKTSVNFTEFGEFNSHGTAKCVIFPKGKTTWEGFQRPFKDGDVVVDTLGGIHIMRNASTSYCYFDRLGILDKTETSCVRVDHLATEEEKQKLFQAIKDNGYYWNKESKTLEKLIEPKFKIGDRIKYRSGEIIYRIVQITEDSYVLDNFCSIPISIEHMYNLVPKKFDINTLKPYDKVLVRGDVGQKWTHDFFGFMDKDKGYPFVCVGHYVIQCIPYEGNEHLLGTTDDCDDFYKTWVK